MYFYTYKFDIKFFIFYVIHLYNISNSFHIIIHIFFQVMYMYYLLGHRLMELPISVDRKEVIAENTYLLTLDGDIDFQPAAVKLLVDLMKKNKNLGAACGRIHPVGSGNPREIIFNRILKNDIINIYIVYFKTEKIIFHNSLILH